MAIASAFLTAGLFGATMALADHDSDTIHACTKPNGSVRIVSWESDCRNNETAISWSQTP